VFGFYCFSYEPVKYGSDYNYPKWAEIVGLCISFSSMMWVPVYAIYYVLTQPGSIMEVDLKMFIIIIKSKNCSLEEFLRTVLYQLKI
jgi:solute carrier family 6 GABA transporter-like protein 1